jgi:hypothetical protein
VKWMFCGLAVVGLAGCVTSPPRLVNEDVAAAQFARLNSGQRAVAATFYDLGAGDTIKRLYWAQRRANETGGTAEASPPVPLQRRYSNVWVPPQVEPDGTEKEGHWIAVETVQFMFRKGQL